MHAYHQPQCCRFCQQGSTAPVFTIVLVQALLYAIVPLYSVAYPTQQQPPLLPQICSLQLEHMSIYEHILYSSQGGGSSQCSDLKPGACQFASFTPPWLPSHHPLGGWGWGKCCERCCHPLSAACCCALQVDWAVAAHERMLQSAHAFFQQHDLLLCPTVMLQPFDASIE